VGTNYRLKIKKKSDREGDALATLPAGPSASK
jgi:hypothetical protein